MELKKRSSIDTLEASRDIHQVVYSDIKPHKECIESVDNAGSEAQVQVSKSSENKLLQRTPVVAYLPS